MSSQGCQIKHKTECPVKSEFQINDRYFFSVCPIHSMCGVLSGNPPTAAGCRPPRALGWQGDDAFPRHLPGAGSLLGDAPTLQRTLTSGEWSHLLQSDSR